MTAFSLDRFSLTEAQAITSGDVHRLNRLPYDFPGLWVEWLKGELLQGRAHVANVSFDGRQIGTLVWRVEQATARELVVMAAASSDDKTPLATFISAAIDWLAQEQKCASARIHTTRPGMVRFAHAHGWQTSEIVIRKHYG